jgi:hypothetical protein
MALHRVSRLDRTETPREKMFGLYTGVSADSDISQAQDDYANDWCIG